MGAKPTICRRSVAQSTAPVLYVEFRKDGQPINPDPWWGGGQRRCKDDAQTRIAFWAFLVMAVLAAGTTVFNVSQTQSATTPNTELYKQLDLFGDVFERVRADYVEKPDDEKLIEAAINGMLTSLDPHSCYMNAKSFRDMQVQTRGEFGGLGIEVTMENGYREGGVADRRYAGARRRASVGRPDHGARQGGRSRA